MDREKISLTGVQETLLLTLYSKAMDSRSSTPVLGDREADAAMRRIDYDFSKIRVSHRDQIWFAARTKSFDRAVERYLDAHPDCTVLHLGCGLDGRAHRVGPPPTVRWYDIDVPDVIALRHRLDTQCDGQRTIASSVTAPDLLDRIPGDTPVLVVAEGLTPYLSATEGVAMLQRIVDHFPRGELLFDASNRMGAWLMQRYGPVRVTGARLEWSIDDPHELERAVPGLLFAGEWWHPSPTEMRQHYPWRSRPLLWILLHTPLRRLGRGLRYHFDGRSG